MPENAAASLTPFFTLLRDAGGFRVFVETATGSGDMATVAGDVFDTVITMEADRAVYETAHERLSGRKGILPLSGDPREMVPNLMPRLVAPAVFWLNAQPDAGEALPPGLSAVLAVGLDHVVCLPGPAAPGEALAAALAQGNKPREIVTRRAVTILVPRGKAGLAMALAEPRV